MDTDDHREWGKRTNGRCWELLAIEQRTADDDRELIDCAHASLWHWRYAGTTVNVQRGEWMISHAYAAIGDGTAALRHAEYCNAVVDDDLADFDTAYACEAMWRAHTLLGNAAEAAAWHSRAETAGAAIANDEDRSIFEGDFTA